MNKHKIPVHCFGDDDAKHKTPQNNVLKLFLITFLLLSLIGLVLLLAVPVTQMSLPMS